MLYPYFDNNIICYACCIGKMHVFSMHSDILVIIKCIHTKKKKILKTSKLKKRENKISHGKGLSVKILKM